MTGTATRTASEGLAIQEVSRLLAVPAPTLRAWELRYGVPDTPRSAGGHRRYSPEAVHQVRLMRDEIARGRRAGEAARAVRTLMAQSGTPRELVDEFLAAAVRMDPAGLAAALDRAHSELGLAGAVDDVLMPAMRQVGDWWESGRCDVAQEHLTSETARSWIGGRASGAPAPAHPSPVVLACGPRDQHTLGMEALAALLVHAGWPARVLGARTPPQALLSAVRATGAAAAVVVSHLSVGRRPAIESISVVAREGTPVFFAGNAFLFGRARQGLPATYLGERLGDAAGLLDKTLVSPSPGRRNRPVLSRQR